jgi:NAD(P)-dependent dehydrogenase (short-subunit alcohol dehydrogenase family)
MSKAAVIQMTKAMALEWGRFEHQRQRHLPGLHRHRDQPPPLADRAGARSWCSMLPRKRVGEPADLDALVVLLASSQSHFINGAVIAADDGFGV